jgi:protein TonB
LAFRVFTPPPLISLNSTQPIYNYAARQRSPIKHWRSIALVVLLHLALLWAIQSGLAHKVVQVAKVVVQAELISEVTPSLPPPPAPKTPPLPPSQTPVPSPSSVPNNAAPTQNTNTASSSFPVSSSTPSPSTQVTSSRTDAVGIFCQAPAYPRGSIRLEEEGEVSLSFVVGVDGNVVKVDILKSSGFKRLDDAAIQQIYKWQFKPALVDGKPIEQTKTKRMKFSLSNEHTPSDDAKSAC